MIIYIEQEQGGHMKTLNIQKIRKFVMDGKIRWTNHVVIRLFQRNISQEDVEKALLNGEIIEEYQNDYPYPSCLVYGLNIKNDVIHDIQEGFDEDNKKATTVDVTIIGKRFSFTKKDGVIVGSQLTMNHGNPTDLFELDDESDGTRRLFDLIPLYRKGKENYVIFVDEIDRSFHTKLTLEFLQKFFEKTEGIKSQIIVTLHDSNVMNLNIFRQDEIWFVERKEDHSSEIYSLNKFKERFDHSVAKDYLLGRYGAVPNFGIEDWNQEEVD